MRERFVVRGNTVAITSNGTQKKLLWIRNMHNALKSAECTKSAQSAGFHPERNKATAWTKKRQQSDTWNESRQKKRLALDFYSWVAHYHFNAYKIIHFKQLQCSIKIWLFSHMCTRDHREKKNAPVDGKRKMTTEKNRHPHWVGNVKIITITITRTYPGNFSL